MHHAECIMPKVISAKLGGSRHAMRAAAQLPEITFGNRSNLSPQAGQAHGPSWWTR